MGCSGSKSAATKDQNPEPNDAPQSPKSVGKEANQGIESKPAAVPAVEAEKINGQEIETKAETKAQSQPTAEGKTAPFPTPVTTPFVESPKAKIVEAAPAKVEIAKEHKSEDRQAHRQVEEQAAPVVVQSKAEATAVVAEKITPVEESAEKQPLFTVLNFVGDERSLKHVHCAPYFVLKSSIRNQKVFVNVYTATTQNLQASYFDLKSRDTHTVDKKGMSCPLFHVCLPFEFSTKDVESHPEVLSNRQN